MAGSLRRFLYTSDDGEQYRIQRDESNTEVLNSDSDQEDSIPSATVPSLPDGYETRYAILYNVSNPVIKRKVTILSQDVFSSLDGATDFSLQIVGSSNVNFRISSLIGEKRELGINADSGQNDGDSETQDETGNDDA